MSAKHKTPARTRIVLAIGLALTVVDAGASDRGAGKQKSAVCQQCHGADGNSTDPQFPRLAGQHEDYLVKALSDYKSGERKNAVMAPFAANLSPTDMEDLAAWFAAQPKGLWVPR